MNRDLHNYRVSYDRAAISIENMLDDPMDQFAAWFNEVEKEGSLREPNTMNLATLAADGYVKSRIVLLKGYDVQGFRFYTNYHSEKGRAIAHNPKVGLSFFWPNMERQVIIKGIAEQLTAADSDHYFKSRPVDSQLGAWVSEQSDVIQDRTYLETRMEALKAKYENKAIPRPKHWGGYLVRPISIEFWQGRPSRLHDRIRYTLEREQWIKERLAP